MISKQYGVLGISAVKKIAEYNLEIAFNIIGAISTNWAKQKAKTKIQVSVNLSKFQGCAIPGSILCHE